MADKQKEDKEAKGEQESVSADAIAASDELEEVVFVLQRMERSKKPWFALGAGY
jgi:hypothetical protein